MNLHVGVGASDDLDEPADAVLEAVQMATRELKGVPVVAAIVFASIDFDQEELMRELKGRLGDIPMVGCTTDGEISSRGTFADSISIMLLGGKSVRVISDVAEALTPGGPHEQARLAAARMVERMGGAGQFVLTFPDCSASGTFNDFLGGMKDVLGRQFPIFGGGPGDKGRLKGITYQYCDFQVYQDAGPMLMLEGEFTFASGLRSGVLPFGKAALCTRSEKNLVFEIDNRPAIEHHRAYLGDETVENTTIAQFPYILSNPGELENSEYFVTRATFGWVPDVGAIISASPIPEGTSMKLGRCTRENILKGAQAAAEELVTLLDGQIPKVLFMFSCSGRKQILGMDVHRELETVQSVLGTKIPTLGFYCYGELGPLTLTQSHLSECEYHGYTLSMLALA